MLGNLIEIFLLLKLISVVRGPFQERTKVFALPKFCFDEVISLFLPITWHFLYLFSFPLLTFTSISSQPLFCQMMRRNIQLQVAGNVADSLSQIFLLTPRPEVRRRAYEIMGASSAREFAARVEYHINAYLQLGTESNDQR